MILRASDGRVGVALDMRERDTYEVVRLDALKAEAAEAAEGEDAPVRIRVLGYRQTREPAAKGGEANAKGFRVRPAALRALARSFRGKPFLSGHDWSDVRARGGTILDSRFVDLDSRFVGIEFDIEVTAEWAIEALEEGRLDRFSIGVIPEGETLCTVHGTPAFGDCYCFPGEMVAVAGGEAEVEWEHEGGEGVELSAVNVPAVAGTGIIGDRTAELAALCGRPFTPRAPQGDSPAARAPITMAASHATSNGAHQMDPELLKSLNLPPTATAADVAARVAQLNAASSQAAVLSAQLEASSRELAAARDRDAQAAREREAAHVDQAIVQLRAERQVTDAVVDSLRATAANGRAAFDATLAIVAAAAPPALATPAGRPVLQSDAKPATLSGDSGGEPDAYEQIRSNPNTAKMLRACGLKPDQVREHGPRGGVVVLGNLAELVAKSRD
jgi:hypothetical protein